MAEVTVKQLAGVVGTPVERLLEQLGEAGVGKSSAEDTVNDEEKMKLLEYLRQSHGRVGTAGSSEESDSSRITLRRKRTSELKVGGAGGRKAVNVEVRGKRTYVKRSVATGADQERREQAEAERQRKEEELREQEEKRLAAEEAKRAEEERQRQEREEAQRRAQEEEERQKREAEEQARREAEEKERQERERTAAAAQPEPAPAAPAPESAGKSERGRDDRRRGGKRRGARGDDDRAKGPDELHVAKGKSGKRRDKKQKTSRAAPVHTGSKHGFEKPTAPVKREVSVPETITVGDLANQMAVKAPQLIKALMGMGVMATINQTLDQETALLLVEEMGHTPIPQSDSDVEEALTQDVVPEQTAEPVTRPPVITVMGHVDHGKTSLLDYIRRTKVTAGEAGGITQHIGAYHVETPNGTVTFLDTPGHAAFTAMRARGAQATDIVVLVVAADDGVKPQTIEAIQHARAAEVPLVVAVNKIDKEGADLDRVRNELSQHEVISEEWGGDTIFANVSALKGEGIDGLIDSILLQAEVLELKAPPEGPARGVVVEATVEKGRGPVATVLVQSGRLHRGDIVLCGSEYGRVRAMFDEAGKKIDSAGPSMPAVLLGLSNAPGAGDDMAVVADERKARELAEFRRERSRDQRLAQRQATSAEDIFSQIREDETKVINCVVKADVQGSYEALRDSLEKLSGDEVKVKVIGGGVGGINESDVNLAIASNAVLVGFNTRTDSAARKLVDEHDIEVRYHSVIYDVIDVVKSQISGMLEPEIREQIIGLAEVKDVFKSPKFGQIAGCLVVDGVVRKSAPIRVLRDNVVIYEGELESLRRFKDDVSEVRMGTECGIGVRNYTDVRAGDQIEVFERTEVARTV
ncbi:translation initiation factor IF-2 [Halofilum ochraceum]|uniref:translation initiation factor IF-2 n=1 Tax=Halofilum ochraceum TaxID=1611323 RepID=UPI0008DA0B5A|nr:translation initiation factor IF-2 [Halofilum ochraceum]